MAGKVDNMRVTLLRTARREVNVEAAVGAKRLQEIADNLDAAESVDQLMGWEGAASRGSLTRFPGHLF